MVGVRGLEDVGVIGLERGLRFDRDSEGEGKLGVGRVSTARWAF